MIFLFNSHYSFALTSFNLTMNHAQTRFSSSSSNVSASMTTAAQQVHKISLLFPLFLDIPTCQLVFVHLLFIIILSSYVLISALPLGFCLFLIVTAAHFNFSNWNQIGNLRIWKGKKVKCRMLIALISLLSLKF